MRQRDASRFLSLDMYSDAFLGVFESHKGRLKISWLTRSKNAELFLDRLRKML